jgi:hypothetical protein
MAATAVTSGTSTERVPTDRLRKAALIAGVLYVVTFFSIPTLALYGPIKEAGYIAGPGPDTGAFVGGALELIVGLACIGTAVALYPVVRRQNEILAMGFVGARVLEAALIFVGVASLWTIVSLRQDGAGADAVFMGETLVAFYDRVFLVSQGFIPTLNALLLGSVLYQSRLVPRVLPILGFIGAATLLFYNTSVLLGFSGEVAEVLALIAVLPIATWEFSLGVYLIAKGFRQPALSRLAARPDPMWLPNPVR